MGTLLPWLPHMSVVQTDSPSLPRSCRRELENRFESEVASLAGSVIAAFHDSLEGLVDASQASTPGSERREEGGARGGSIVVVPSYPYLF